jgi:hypothetical protein
MNVLNEQMTRSEPSNDARAYRSRQGTSGSLGTLSRPTELEYDRALSAAKNLDAEIAAVLAAA